MFLAALTVKIINAANEVLIVVGLLHRTFAMLFSVYHDFIMDVEGHTDLGHTVVVYAAMGFLTSRHAAFSR